MSFNQVQTATQLSRGMVTVYIDMHLMRCEKLFSES